MRDVFSKWWRAAVLIVLGAAVVRGLTAYFIGTHLDDAGWFPFGIFQVFHEQAVGILDGSRSTFWISPDDPSSAIYPPGYSLWLAAVYFVSGTTSIHVVQVLQTVLDSASVLLIVAIGANTFGRAAGIAAGCLAALSPLLAFYGATPLADAPTSWIVLSGILLIVIAYQKASLPYALASGLMLGASCWFRANGILLAVVLGAALMLLTGRPLRKRLSLAAGILLASMLVIAPIVIRNSIAFQAFVPTGLGAGTNLWEGLGETDRAAEFGATYGDRELIEKERVEQQLGDDPRVSLYFPNGVERDRERAKRALDIITQNPVWYAGVIAKRMWGLLKYAGQDSGIYGSTGVNITPAKSLPEALRIVPLSTAATLIGWSQSVLRYLILPLIVLGVAVSFRRDMRLTLLLLSVVFYYLAFGSFLHSEIRYSLPMQALLMVFAGAAAAAIARTLIPKRFEI